MDNMAVAHLPSSTAEQENYGLVVFQNIGNLGQPESDCSLATGVAFSSDHEVIVADPTYNRLQIFTTRGRLHRVIQPSEPGAGKLHNPSKVAVNPKNGSIYVTEQASNLGIKMFNSNGFFVKSFGEHDDYSEAKALTVDNENNVLLLEQKECGSVIFSVIDENGHSRRRNLSSRLRNPNGIAVWVGKVYISAEEGDYIKIYDYSGNYLGRFERITKRIFGVCVSEDGEVLVGAKTFNGFKITRFKTDGTFVSFHSSRTYHHDIRNMAVQGKYLVLATCDGVFVYLPRKDGDVSGGLRTSGSATIQRIQIDPRHSFALLDDNMGLTTYPTGVAVLGQPFTDVIYVSDRKLGRIKLFNSSGAYLGQFEARLKNPRKIITDWRTNNVLVIDSGPQPHIVIFSSTGEMINKIGIGFLSIPFSLAVDRYGKIFVIEYRSCFLKVFDIFGSQLYQVNCKSASFPADIAISDKDEIFLVENDFNCIQVYDCSGELLRRIGNFTITRSPLFVAIVRDGLIVVADKTLHINLTYFTEEGSFVGAYRSSIKHRTCKDISVMSDGSIVVASDGRCCQIYVYYTCVIK